MKTKYKHIHFVMIEQKTKTSVWVYLTNQENDGLGSVKWYSPWRRYCFFPVAETVYEKTCLTDIIHFIKQL